VQGVSLVNDQFPEPRSLLRQGGDKVTIQLYDIESPTGPQERQRDGPLAGTDFNQALARLWVYGLHDALDHPRVVQKILPETFARTVVHRIISIAQ
jgi:hypothetical protein